MSLRGAERIGYWVAVALVVAGITHILAILTLPRRSARDAYAALAAAAPGSLLRTVPLPSPDGAIPDQDPALPGSFCLFDLRNGPVTVGLVLRHADFVAMAVYGRHGRLLYGLSSRSATQDRLALTISTAPPVPRQAGGTDGAPDIAVQADEPEGYVVAQALAPTPSAIAAAKATAARLVCRAAPR